MRVHVEGDRDLAVAEAFADHLGVDASFEGECCPGVAETMNGEVGEAVFLDGSFEGLVDALVANRHISSQTASRFSMCARAASAGLFV